MDATNELLAGHAWTIAAWVRAKPAHGADRVLVARGAPGMSHFRLYIQAHFGLLRFYTGNSRDVGCGVIDDDRWHHVAVTQREYALTFYFDGMALYTFNVPGGIVAGDDPVTTGRLPDGTLPFDGAIEDLRLLNRSSSADDIEAWMKATPHPQTAASVNNRIPSAPLYVDPLFNSAKDGQVVWNRVERNWWFLYMQIRNGMKEPGAAIHHGTTLGAASSDDGGLTWRYRGTLRGLETEPGRNTFWAPHVVWHEGRYHAIITRVQGICPNWEGDRRLLHYVGDDLLNWRLAGPIEGLDSLRTLDGCLYRLPDGLWGLWYKDEAINRTCYAEGDDAFRFRKLGEFDPPSAAVEGPEVFCWHGQDWLLADDCGTHDGLRVYRSRDGRTWERRDNILSVSGARPGDQGPAHHASVVTNGGRAFVFYWTTVEASGLRNSEGQLCVLQVAELSWVNGELECDRDRAFGLDLPRDRSVVRKVFHLKGRLCGGCRDLFSGLRAAGARQVCWFPVIRSVDLLTSTRRAVLSILSRMGYQFENLVLSNLDAVIRRLDIAPEGILSAAPYFQRRTLRHGACQVDLLLQTKNTLYVCEVKFRKQIDPASILDVPAVLLYLNETL